VSEVALAACCRGPNTRLRSVVNRYFVPVFDGESITYGTKTGTQYRLWVTLRPRFLPAFSGSAFCHGLVGTMQFGGKMNMGNLGQEDTHAANSVIPRSSRRREGNSRTGEASLDVQTAHREPPACVTHAASRVFIVERIAASTASL